MDFKQAQQFIIKKQLTLSKGKFLLKYPKPIFSLLIQLDDVKNYPHKINWRVFGNRIDFPFDRVLSFPPDVWLGVSERDDLSVEFIKKYWDYLIPEFVHDSMSLDVINHTMNIIPWSPMYLSFIRFGERDDEKYPNIVWDNGIWVDMFFSSTREHLELEKQRRANFFSHLKYKKSLKI